MLTGATPKIASYPFTTLHVNVGIMHDDSGSRRAVIADIPGIVNGAHGNRGLGLKSLKHIERCKALIHLADMSGIDNRDPVQEFSDIRTEISHYDSALLRKRSIAVANKMDTSGAANNLKSFRERYGVEVLGISCANGLGLDALRGKIFELTL
jgi:GTP-binding protein